MAASFFALFSQTFRSIAAQWRAVALSVCAVAAVLMLAQGIYAWRVEAYRASLFDQSAVERDAEELTTLLDRQRAGENVTAQVQAARRRMSERLQTLAGRQTIVGFWMNLGPALLLSWFLAALALIGGLLHGMQEAVSPGRRIKDMLVESARAIGPLSLLLVMLFGITLLWIPAGAVLWTHVWPQSLTDSGSTVQTALVFFGYLVAILLLPRLLLAPLLVAGKSMAPLAAIQESFWASRGYWGKMLGNVMVAGLVLFFTSLTVWLMIAPSITGIPVLALLLREAMTGACMVTFGLFLGHLSVSVWEHPLLPAEDLPAETEAAVQPVSAAPVMTPATTQPTLA